ncbi:MAG: hypothetical protein IIV18_01815 [Lachnospiraceae bacterium]|nr:hypothetical protein [Lachnospiraceae bacterium]
MKLLKKMALLSLCVFALSGCTQSSVTADSIVIKDDMVTPEDLEMVEEDIVVDRTMKITQETDPYVFDWEQVSGDAVDMFVDEDYYPLGVDMSYEEDLEAKSIKLMWVLKNEATDGDALEYAVELVQQFNNIMATQKDGVAFSTVDTFGGIWDFFNLTVQVSKEDGTMMIDKTYKIGEKIDLPLPEFGGDGPSGPQAATEAQVSPGSK